MNVNKLTERVQNALMEAQSLATGRGHQQIDCEHLLAALLDQPDGLASLLLERAGIAPATVRAAL